MRGAGEVKDTRREEEEERGKLRREESKQEKQRVCELFAVGYTEETRT